ncbi:MAG: hypothetical protein EBR82_30140 [Caulobacteraceae bacterium]|nr:hypothetical protein [Caulobacteraceae bacterium]
MTVTLESANDSLRDAVALRMAATDPSDPKMQGYKPGPLAGCEPAQQCAAELLARQSCCEGTRLRSDHSDPYSEWPVVTIAEQTLRQAVAAVRDRHTKYGPPTEHFARTAALVNAAFGTTFTSADWALVMVLDKIARQRGTAPTDDAAVDIAGYAACHQECRNA